METLIIILAGIIITVATYMLLSKHIIRVIIGSALLTHAGHLLLMTMGGFGHDSAPIIGENSTNYADSLPQALILTSIVINFAVTAFFLVLAYKTYEEMNGPNLHVLRGKQDG